MPVYYINADDNARGIAQKQKLLAPFGIYQLAPGHNGFEVKKMFTLLRNVTESGEASQVLLIFDTVKKLADLLDSKSVNAMNRHIESFVSAGGTFVGLGHVNKNKNEDGELVYKGTSDILDDFQAVWLGTPTTDDESDYVNVDFKALKRRGDQPESAQFRYLKSLDDYSAMFDSVERVPVTERDRISAQANATREAELHCVAIDAITSAIADGTNTKTLLIQTAAEQTGESKSYIEAVLAQFTGSDKAIGGYWQMRRGSHNRHEFQITQ